MMVKNRADCPKPQVASHVQSDHPPTQSTGQWSLFHQQKTVITISDSSAQVPSSSNWKVREVVPLSPHVSEHSPHSVQDPVQSGSHGSPPHDSRRVESSLCSHGLPPFSASWVTTKVLKRRPTPHVASHEPQMLHPPEQSTASGKRSSVVVPDVVVDAIVVVEQATFDSQPRA